MCIRPSEVRCERTFSFTARMADPRRSSINPKTFEAATLLRENMDLSFQVDGSEHEYSSRQRLRRSTKGRQKRSRTGNADAQDQT